MKYCLTHLENGRRLFFHKMLNEEVGRESFSCAFREGAFGSPCGSPHSSFIEHKDFLIPICDKHLLYLKGQLPSNTPLILTEDGFGKKKSRLQILLMGIGGCIAGGIMVLIPCLIARFGALLWGLALLGAGAIIASIVLIIRGLITGKEFGVIR